MTPDFQTCRLCGETSFQASRIMLKFGTRHWAHKTCWLEKRGLDGLTKNQILDLPFKKVKELGLLDEVERRTTGKKNEYGYMAEHGGER